MENEKTKEIEFYEFAMMGVRVIQKWLKSIIGFRPTVEQVVEFVIHTTRPPKAFHTLQSDKEFLRLNYGKVKIEITEEMYRVLKLTWETYTSSVAKISMELLLTILILARAVSVEFPQGPLLFDFQNLYQN